MADHIAAIHVLKGKLSLSDDDYRVLLRHLTGKDSSKACNAIERQRVRDHMASLVKRQGGQPGRAGAQPFNRAARALERKVWAMWGALGKAGKLDAPTPAGLQAWIQRQLGVDNIRFCTDAQLHTLIESLKLWQGR